MIVKYGKYEVEGKDLLEVANKLSNYLEMGDIATSEGDVNTLVLKAVVRVQAERNARAKRLEKDGIEGKAVAPKVTL